MKNSMRIKVKKSFMSPLTNRIAQVDSEMNVPQNRFWFKRIAQGDCEKIKMQIKAKAAPVKDAVVDKPKKGSK